MKKVLFVAVVMSVLALSALSLTKAQATLGLPEVSTSEYDPCEGRTVLGHRIDSSGQAQLVCAE